MGHGILISFNRQKSREKLEYLKNQEKGAICVTSGANEHVELTKLIVLVSTVFISTALKKVSNQKKLFEPQNETHDPAY